MKLKRDFGKDFEHMRKVKGFSSRASVATELGKVMKKGIRETTIASWAKGGFPLADKWEAIKEVLGIDCSEYADHDQPITITQSPQAQGVVKAMDGSSVTVNNMAGTTQQRPSRYVVELEEEWQYHLALMFKKYGTRAMGDACMQRLNAIAAFIG